MGRQRAPDDVLAISRDYQPACVLAAAVDLDVFAVLAGKRLSAEAVATAVRADGRAMAILLDALAAMELVCKDGDTYTVAADVAELLTESGSRSILAMARHQANCLRRWVQLPQVVQAGEPANRVPSIRGEAADEAAFIGAMHNVSAPLLEDVLGALRPLRFRRLLDIGGASGTWTIAFLREVPEASAILFDLATVIPLARDRTAAAGLAGRVTFAPGDFYTDPLPGGTDLAWVSAIVHQNSRAQNRALFAKVHQALVFDGVIVIRDIVMDATRTRPASGALFAINMLVGTPRGGTYTFLELREDLLAAGFADPTLIRQGEWMDSIVRAVKRA